jgi:ankyrin repeat protein
MEGRSSKRLKTSDMDNTISVMETEEIVLFTPMRLALANKLIEVCFAGDLNQAQNLIREQADAWIQNDDGQTALHAAVCKSSLSLTSSTRNEM